MEKSPDLAEMHSPWLSSLHIYPVKSLGGISLQESELTPEGLRFDRRWMVMDEENIFFTQRTVPAMTQIGTQLFENELQLFERKNPSNHVSIPFHYEGEKIRVKVWDDEVDAAKENKESSEWLSDALQKKCSLVKMAGFSRREVDANYAGRHTTGFADSYPVLLTNQSSLNVLNEKLERPVPMARFRPNIVVSRMDAFSEDETGLFSFGDVRLQCVKPCARCVLVNVEPDTGEKGLEPLKTLAKFRTRDHKVWFGQNVVVLSPGILKVGMPFSHIQNI